MATKPKPTIDQDGKTVRQPHMDLSSLPGVLAATTKTFNGVMNGEIDHRDASQMNRATATAVQAQKTMIDTMVKVEAGKETLRMVAAQFCGLSPLQLASGTEEKKPRRPRQGPDKAADAAGAKA